MTIKPLRVCRHHGCPQLTANKSGYCPEHLKQEKNKYDRQRPSSTKRGYNYRWQKASKIFLARYPLCYYCQQKKPLVVSAATLVDHYIPHHGNHELFWDESNWRSSCDECHNIKTAREDGGFGNRPE